MRYAIAFIAASVVAFLLFWVGAQLAGIVEQPDREHNDFTVGPKMNLCGYVVDQRHEVSGYVLEDWLGSGCRDLSKFDHCLLNCLSHEGTIDIGAACYSDCFERAN